MQIYAFASQSERQSKPFEMPFEFVRIFSEQWGRSCLVPIRHYLCSVPQCDVVTHHYLTLTLTVQTYTGLLIIITPVKVIRPPQTIPGFSWELSNTSVIEFQHNSANCIGVRINYRAPTVSPLHYFAPTDFMHILYKMTL